MIDDVFKQDMATVKINSTKRTKGEARRQAIEAEARQVLLSEGYACLSLRTIASSLGMSVGNLQYYFPTKDDLVEAIITREIETSLSVLWEIPWDPATPDLCTRAAVSALLHHHASDAGQFYAIAEFLALHDPRYALLKTKGYAFVFSYIEQLVGLMAPHLETDRRARLAQVLVALIDGASLQVQFAHASSLGDGVDALANDIAFAVEQLLENWS
ncbi:TetR/AcrR family transcriptional regulator [Exilibacterium tricleocarpae]|uniref:TetR/AcrR family transcriptional regulator n=1 Tax=Exilibacterium tricleocarpae TaxID=2591008 RepID=A0A545U9A0_9GAMM|nr:TetR/AcrR family transcriptional regulator [Exilibacterium tricleocarpae]TQV86047.1 TetR/AcrR family transcriptional regulator [Exilibacterium tricleocarpae]